MNYVQYAMYKVVPVTSDATMSVVAVDIEENCVGLRKGGQVVK